MHAFSARLRLRSTKADVFLSCEASSLLGTFTRPVKSYRWYFRLELVPVDGEGRVSWGGHLLGAFLGKFPCSAWTRVSSSRVRRAAHISCPVPVFARMSSVLWAGLLCLSWNTSFAGEFSGDLLFHFKRRMWD